jgi:hypothetical protein
MAEPGRPLPDHPLLSSLTPEERTHLETRRFVRSGNDVVWIEPGGGVRREAAARLYYIQTDRGVFRVSRLNGEVIEV